MQVILRDDMDNLGKSGEVVNVKEGYARNYLLPRGLRRQGDRRATSRASSTKSGSSRRAPPSWPRRRRPRPTTCRRCRVSIARAVGEEDKLFGSVTSRDIAEALNEQGVIVDAKKIHLDEPIKALGLTEVPVKLGRGVTATIKVWVVKKEA